MYPSMTGKAYPVMTVVVPYQVMIATTVNTATEITVHNAAAIVRDVIPQSVWAVLMDVPRAMNRSVRTVQLNVKIASKRSARIV